MTALLPNTAQKSKHFMVCICICFSHGADAKLCYFYCLWQSSCINDAFLSREGQMAVSSLCGSVSHLFFLLSFPMLSLSISEFGKEFNPKESSLMIWLLISGPRSPSELLMYCKVDDVLVWPGRLTLLRWQGFNKPESKQGSKSQGS
jgi:hypothetical protein